MTTFAADKADILDLIKARNCKYADFIDRGYKSYSDSTKVIAWFNKEIDCMALDDTFLEDILAVIGETDLQTYGIYYNQSGTSISDIGISAVIKSTYDSVELPDQSEETIVPDLVITRQSNITTLTIGAKVHINTLCIAEGSTVGTLELDPTARIDYLRIMACNDNVGTLTNAIPYPSDIGAVIVDDGAVYGGRACKPGSSYCDSEVTSITTTPGSGSMHIEWTAAALNTGNIIAQYRRQGDIDWLEAEGDVTADVHSLYVDWAGLEENTYYDFLIQNQCEEDGPYSSGVIVTAQTLGGA